MNIRHRKCVAVAISAGVALFLASTAVGAQPYGPAAPGWGPQWQQWPHYQYQPWLYHGGAYPNPAIPFVHIPWFGPNLSAMSQGLGGGWSGASSNLQDMGDHYQFELSMPGVDPNDLDMRVEGRVLSVSVVSKGSQGSQQQGQWQSFAANYRQVFTLPQPVDSSRMQSRFEEGVLTVTLPKLTAGN